MKKSKMKKTLMTAPETTTRSESGEERCFPKVGFTGPLPRGRHDGRVTVVAQPEKGARSQFVWS